MINIGASLVELLFSLPLTRGKKMPSKNRSIIDAFGRCMKAHGIHSTYDYDNFEHMCPTVPQQENEYSLYVYYPL